MPGEVEAIGTSRIPVALLAAAKAPASSGQAVLSSVEGRAIPFLRNHDEVRLVTMEFATLAIGASYPLAAYAHQSITNTYFDCKTNATA
jgi:hypothetical protein